MCDAVHYALSPKDVNKGEKTHFGKTRARLRVYEITRTIYRVYRCRIKRTVCRVGLPTCSMRVAGTRLIRNDYSNNMMRI